MSSKPIDFLDDTIADTLLAAARCRASELGLKVSIAIVDGAGQLIRFERQVGAILISLSMAQDKAYTAAAFDLPTHEWMPLMKDDFQLLHGISNYPHVVIIGGGLPIRISGKLVGGIGVSGGHYRDDVEIAEAALAALPASEAA